MASFTSGPTIGRDTFEPLPSFNAVVDSTQFKQITKESDLKTLHKYLIRYIMFAPNVSENSLDDIQENTDYIGEYLTGTNEVAYYFSLLYKRVYTRDTGRTPQWTPEKWEIIQEEPNTIWKRPILKVKDDEVPFEAKTIDYIKENGMDIRFYDLGPYGQEINEFFSPYHVIEKIITIRKIKLRQIKLPDLAINEISNFAKSSGGKKTRKTRSRRYKKRTHRNRKTARKYT
jgi:hypothetical protein